MLEDVIVCAYVSALAATTGGLFWTMRRPGSRRDSHAR